MEDVMTRHRRRECISNMQNFVIDLDRRSLKKLLCEGQGSDASGRAA